MKFKVGDIIGSLHTSSSYWMVIDTNNTFITVMTSFGCQEDYKWEIPYNLPTIYLSTSILRESYDF